MLGNLDKFKKLIERSQIGSETKVIILMTYMYTRSIT